MTLVHEVNKTKVIKKSNKFYTIESEIELNKTLLYKNLISSGKIKQTNNDIVLMVDNIESLDKYLKKNNNKLEYNKVEKLLKDLIIVIDSLSNYGLMFVNLDINDIIVIDESIFMFINYNNIYKVTDDNSISIEDILTSSRFNNKNEFVQESIPYSINIKTIYYNIGNLIFYCLFNKLYDNNKLSIYPIYYTKLYWFLERCLENDINNRVFLFV
tara:strand:- start:3681 stop:4322 length:642 start_codon:yes stop_codon:yes gene_type:complete